jgi:phage-related protein
MKKRRASLPEKKLVRPVIWVGDSKKQLKKMPDEVQDQLGGELYLAQIGLMPPHAKPFKGVGGGVFELRDDYVSDTYRLVYAVQIGKRLYVLHAFQKKSKTRIATPQKDIDLIAKRYRDACDLEKEYET